MACGVATSLSQATTSSAVLRCSAADYKVASHWCYDGLDQMRGHVVPPTVFDPWQLYG